MKRFKNVIRYDYNTPKGKLLTYDEKRQYYQPHLFLIAPAIGSGISSFYYFNRAKNTKQLIDEEDSPKILRKLYNTEITLGITNLVMSMFWGYFALEKFEMYADDTFIGAEYKF